VAVLGILGVIVQNTIGIGSLIVAVCVMLLAVPASFVAWRTWKQENEARDAREESARFQRQMKAYIEAEKKKADG
jgi:hypothetical protein